MRALCACPLLAYDMKLCMCTPAAAVDWLTLFIYGLNSTVTRDALSLPVTCVRGPI